MVENGIHHVTAISGPAWRNLDFYTRVLGLRLVKKTVNFDDPGTYHLYYGDEVGSPGTILTFFPWEHVAPGRMGVGETVETTFRVPEGSVGYWTHRFLEKGVAHGSIEKRFGESVLSFKDTDGTGLALVAVRGIENEPGWSDGEVPPEHAIRGFHGVKLLLRESGPTGAILTDVLGFVETGREGSVVRFKAGETRLGGIVDIHVAGDFLRGRLGGGSVHHIAFRAATTSPSRDAGIAQDNSLLLMPVRTRLSMQPTLTAISRSSFAMAMMWHCGLPSKRTPPMASSSTIACLALSRM